ncbi:MAG: hypothetical protein KGJ80_02345 [Chloroflexota bacterium]|nr:hypothetical protein [Chloroflexota bacterium]
MNGREILARVVALPIQTWNYKSQAATFRHIGPMAQDFYAAFNLGEDDKTISTVDADGVALAAIQGLNQIVEEKETRIATVEAQMSALQKQNTALEARLTALEQQARNANASSNSQPVMLGLGALVLLGIVYSKPRAQRGEQ